MQSNKLQWNGPLLQKSISLMMCFHHICLKSPQPLSNLGHQWVSLLFLCGSCFIVDTQRYRQIEAPVIHLEHSSSPNYSLSNCESGYITCFLCAEQPRKLSPFHGLALCGSLSEAQGAQSSFVLSVMNSLTPHGRVQVYGRVCLST